MSHLRYLNKFLDGAVVKHMPMGQIISRRREKGKSNHDIRTVYSVSNTQGLVNAEDFRDNTIHSKDTSNYTIVQPGMFAYNPSRLNIGSIAFLKTDTAGLVSPMYVVFSVDKNIVTYDYLSLFIKSSYCKNKINSLTEEGARFRFDFERWNLIDVPIPPIKVQTEIVRILDAFTELTAELTAELVARKQQYAYYRESLLTFEEGEVAWKALGDIATINTGQKPSEVLDVETAYDYINAGTSRSGYSRSSNCEGGVVTTPSRGQGGIGYVGYQSQPFWLGSLCYKMNSIDENSLINKYLFYFLQSRSQLLLALKKEGGVPAVNKSDLAKLEIPVPSLFEQQRIVTILDKFEALTTSLTEGLPREIALRQQQYEYYRELLLSFPKPEVADHD